MKNQKSAYRRPPQRPHAVPQVEVNRPSRLVFKPEVLDRVGVTFPALWQWMREGKFPVSREVGGKVAWLETEIDEWIMSRPLRRYKTMEDL